MPSNKPIQIKRKSREWSLMLLYQYEFRNQDMSGTVIDIFRSQIETLEPHFTPKDIEKILGFVTGIVRGIIEKLGEIDKTISENMSNWKLNRLVSVDRNIMRIAVFELLFEEDIPEKVSINEAIEIAKNYGSADSGKFVNGVLDKIRKGISAS